VPISARIARAAVASTPGIHDAFGERQLMAQLIVRRWLVALSVSLHARLLARNVSPPQPLFASLVSDICKPQQLTVALFPDT
jgi:hypothetical protein